MQHLPQEIVDVIVKCCGSNYSSNVNVNDLKRVQQVGYKIIPQYLLNSDLLSTQDKANILAYHVDRLEKLGRKGYKKLRKFIERCDVDNQFFGLNIVCNFQLENDGTLRVNN